VKHSRFPTQESDTPSYRGSHVSFRHNRHGVSGDVHAADGQSMSSARAVCD
jgi:hypothetical protein